MPPPDEDMAAQWLDRRFGQRRHCVYCGAGYVPDQPWPRTCPACGRRSYLNPLPVAVAVQPVGAGVLAIRRASCPARGGLALPGGFIELGEVWQQALVRELREEAGLTRDPGDVELIAVDGGADGTIAVFGVLPGLPRIDSLRPGPEASELTVVDDPTRLAFPAHRRVTAAFLGASGRTAPERPAHPQVW